MPRAAHAHKDDPYGTRDPVVRFVVGASVTLCLYLAAAFMLFTGLDGALPVIALAAVAGGVLNCTRFGVVIWIALALFVVFALVGVYTPAFEGPSEALVREDALGPSDAIVVLSGGVVTPGALDNFGLERMLTALKLADEGYAPVVVRTTLPEGFPPVDKDVAWLRDRIAPEAEVLAVGPVNTTADEARCVAELARDMGWSRIILVTSPMHSRRAAAIFEKTGLEVLSHPCQSRHYSRPKPQNAWDRVYMTRRWIYEVAAWNLYRLRGQIE